MVFMKKILLIISLTLTGCTFQVENPFKKEGDLKQSREMIAAINALNEFIPKLDARVKALEPKKEVKK